MGYQWFSLQDRSHDAMLAGVEAAAPKLQGFLDEVMEYLDLTEEDVFLVGFSQGTMMALHAGVRRERPLGGIVGFSGALVGGDRLPDQIVTKPPVILIHGDAARRGGRARLGAAAPRAGAVEHVAGHAGRPALHQRPQAFHR